MRTTVTVKNTRLRKFMGIFPLFAMPLAILSGLLIFREKNYAFISLVVAVFSLMLFISGFERRKTGTRRLVLVAVLTALAVAGRFIFMPIPGVNPITVITVLSAVYMGKESGFCIGSFSALLSDMYAGLGVWTPFQMFSWGLIGFCAGALSKYLYHRKVSLCVFSFFAGLIFSLIMDVWTVLWYNDTFSWGLYLAAISTALPFTAVYSVSNIVFTILLDRKSVV